MQFKKEIYKPISLMNINIKILKKMSIKFNKKVFSIIHYQKMHIKTYEVQYFIPGGITRINYWKYW